MVDFKAEYHFKDGKLARTVNPDTSGLTTNDIVPIISVIEGMEIAFGLARYKYKINGIIYLNMGNSKLFMKYHISPLEAIPHIEQEIAKMYTVQRTQDGQE